MNKNNYKQSNVIKVTKGIIIKVKYDLNINTKTLLQVSKAATLTDKQMPYASRGTKHGSNFFRVLNTIYYIETLRNVASGLSHLIVWSMDDPKGLKVWKEKPNGQKSNTDCT